MNYASSKSGAEAVVAAIIATGGKAIAIQGDVSKATGAQRIIDTAIAEYGRRDILVNNAGVYEYLDLDAITGEHFHKIFNINVLGLILITPAAVKHIGDGGSIINIGASITSMKPPTSSMYSASKSAVVTITCILAKEFGGKNIRANGANPGPTKTEDSAKMGSGKDLIAQTPLGRLGEPENIAKVAIFMASDDSGWITGDVLVASGGLR